MDSEHAAGMQQQPPTTEASEKKKWVEPEITLHNLVQAVTLAMQCTSTFPVCTSPQPVQV